MPGSSEVSGRPVEFAAGHWAPIAGEPTCRSAPNVHSAAGERENRASRSCVHESNFVVYAQFLFKRTSIVLNHGIDS